MYLFWVLNEILFSKIQSYVFYFVKDNPNPLFGKFLSCLPSLQIPVLLPPILPKFLLQSQKMQSKVLRFRQNLLKDRKSTRLNSSHANISYAVFCLKKKNNGIISIFRSYV